MKSLIQVSKEYNIPKQTLRDRLKTAGYTKVGRDWILTDEMIRECITEYKDGRRKGAK